MSNSELRAKRLDWSQRGWPRVYLMTFLGTVACVAVVIAVDIDAVRALSGSAWMRAVLQDTLLPIGLALPSMFLFLNKIRQLAIAEDKLRAYAAMDSLTAVLNRGAFTTVVNDYLKPTGSQDEPVRGALLIIDADHFKLVNDRFGHDAGDEALRLIANAIKDLLRGPDIVGRMGGEEFGVFLPGTTPEQAETVAERIREAIGDLDFRPAGGERRPLSVSVGGATFADRIGFLELYRIADQRLYAAKEQGRNRVLLVPAADYAAAA